MPSKTESRPVDGCNGIHYGAVRARRVRARQAVDLLGEVLRSAAVAKAVRVVETRAHAARLNAVNRSLGVSHRWKAGDRYFEIAGRVS